jgi:hypothetical protein
MKKFDWIVYSKTIKNIDGPVRIKKYNKLVAWFRKNGGTVLCAILFCIGIYAAIFFMALEVK